MVDTKPFLSICIPTYNNEDILCKTLHNITSDDYFLSSRDVEIVVSDDCSTDHTETVVRSFALQYPGLVRYCRTPSRLAQENPCYALQAASGEFLKLLSDSSSIRSGCLGPWTTILKRLGSSRPIVFLVNEAPLEHESSLTHGEDLEEFLAAASHRCTDADGFGIWREDLAAMTDVARAASSNLFHVDLLLRLLEKKHRSVILRELILDRQGIHDQLTYNVAEVFGANYLALLKYYVDSGALSKRGYDREKRSVLLDHLLPLLAESKHNIETGSLEVHLRDYLGEKYFLPALQKFMRGLSADRQLLNRRGLHVNPLVAASDSVENHGRSCPAADREMSEARTARYVPKKFIFYAPHFDDNSGGSIAIYKLAHLLNEHGHVAKIWHWTRLHQNEIRIINGKVMSEFFIPSGISRVDMECPYSVIEATPEDINDSTVIYPEIIEGNPLGAQKVVRWLLNKPGMITGNTSFGFDDLILYYSEHFLPNRMVPDDRFRIKIIDFKKHIYKDTYCGKREGVYYMVRKGGDVPQTYHPADAVQVDGMSHSELAKIFSTAKTFISYDLHTAYSIYASLCGCDSVVVPRPGVTKEQWKRGGDQSEMYGTAYGFDDLEFARETRSKMIDRINTIEDENLYSMGRFIQACELLN